MITGRTYLERGKPVVVLARWAGGGRPAGRPGVQAGVIWYPPCGKKATYKQAPRNVLIRRRGGATVVRPFRGLLRVPGSA